MAIDLGIFYHANAELRAVLDMIGSGFFSPDEPDRFKPIVDMLLQHGDKYMLLADYASYIACQKKVETAYQDQEQWIRKAILNVANMGKFSSDRTIMQYAQQIWDARPVVHTRRTKMVQVDPTRDVRGQGRL